MTAVRGLDQADRDDIAIIGMSGRFPGAAGIDAFWQNLKDGVESLTPASDEDFKQYGVPSVVRSYREWVKFGFSLDGIDMFDAAFFGFNPREAEVLDPQHRLFLECAWEALEHAGYDTERMSGSVAVYGGATHSGYLQQNVLRNGEIIKAVGSKNAVYGSVADYMVTRVSYKLNLRGPCFFVQSACSTSLVALHLGCQSLRNHEVDLALAGGVSVQIPHRLGYLYEEGGMLSPDGHVRAFDINAKGTVFGSGVGIVVLKRLHEALADGDTIHAIVRGIATNNDGALKVGFTAPSVIGQSQVVVEALANAGVHPEDISYVEAHGTGTELGDPIEISALTRAYQASTDRKGYCAVGSVKPNIGHLDAAAGVCSLIKTVLALEHAQIPPTINYERPNPKIDFDNSPFYVNTALRSWPRNGKPRRAGVSSFGFGGTNAHVIVEEAPEPEPSGPSRGHQLLMLSAKTEEALDEATSRLAEHLTTHPQTNLADAAFTLQLGRRLFKHRRAVLATTVADAIEALHGTDPRRVWSGEAAPRERQVVFMFPGQGSQYVDMGFDLYRDEPAFRAVVDDCAERLRVDLGFDLREAMYPDGGPTEQTSERLKQTAVAQAALFVVEYATAKLWMSWGIEPAAMIGHSIGEFVAACLSGVMKLEDALRLVALRGRLMGQMQPGAMLAVPLPEQELRPMLGDGLWVSAVNTPSMTVISGEHATVEAFAAKLRDRGIDSRPLHTSHAFHSGMMDRAITPLVDVARTIEFGAPAIPYISNVTGTWISESDARDPEYWGRHLRSAVRFADGAAELLKDADRVYLEVGPGATLSALLRQQTNNPAGVATVASMRSPQERTSDVAALLGAVARLWIVGRSVDWVAFYRGERRRRLPLPSYAFQRQRLWVFPELSNRETTRKYLAQTVQFDFADWFYVPTWKRTTALPPLAANGHEPAATCLIFADAGGVAERVARVLADAGRRVIVVQPGAGFQRIDDDWYTIAPGERRDYVALLESLRDRQLVPAAVGHFWAVADGGDRAAVSSEARAERGFYSLVYLAQAWGELGLTSALRITAATRGVHAVTGQEMLIPENATILGPIKVIPLEYPNVRCRHVDLEREPASGDPMIARLAGELFATDSEQIIAYRAGRRWTQRFEPARFDATDGVLPERIRTGGVYLITGGLGGIGLVLAEHLARSAKARLVLTGRRGLPPRETWAEYVRTHGAGEATSRKIRAVEALEALGAEVMIGSADVVDEAAMRRVVQDACDRFGGIDGVVHSAGIAGGGMIQLKKPEVAASVLTPKVTGAQVLERVLDGRRLDFVLLCSSLTGVLGGVGQVDYCAANAYLDAFASCFAAKTGIFTVAVNWNAWREVGMAVDTDVPADLRETLKGQMLASGITNREGTDAFDRVLTHATESQVALSPLDVQALIDTQGLAPADAAQAADDQASARPASAAKAYARPNLQTAYVAPQNETQTKICAIWQQMLGLDRIGIHDNFFELGGHSLLAIQVMARVNQALKSAVPVARLYEGLTVAFLAGAVAPKVQVDTTADEDPEAAERRRDKARRQKEHQQRRRVALGR